MNSFDSQLTDRLHELATAEPDSAPPTQQLLDRGRQARRRRTSLVTGASFAVVAVGAVAAAAIAGTPGAAPGGRVPQGTAAASAAAVADPRLELVAAIANSQNISFQLKATATAQKGDGKTTVPAYTVVTETAFDPATASGYTRVLESDIEYRLVNGVLYQSNAAQWLRYRGTYSSLNLDEDKTRGAFVESADSEVLFQSLRKGDAKVEKTGSDAYRFTATSSEDSGTVTFAGDVVVGPDRRITKVSYDWRLDYHQGGFQQSKVVLEYSGYGVPVTVEVPPNPIPIG